jgi:hypothetical protein
MMDKPRLEELSGHTRVENRTIVWTYLVAFVVAVIIGLILRFAINVLHSLWLREKKSFLSDFSFFFSQIGSGTDPPAPAGERAVRRVVVSIQAAIEANDVLIATLEAIRDAAQGLTIDQGTD